MMDSVAGCNGESPLSFRANRQIKGATRRPCRRMAASMTVAMRGRRMRAECAVIAALVTTAASVVGAAQLPVTTWLRSERAQSGAHGTILTALIRPAPVGEVITPEPPQVPAPTVKPVAPPVAAPPPHAEQPLPAPRKPAPPPPQQEPPAPEPEAPAPQPEAPAPEPEAPAPQPEAPPPQQQAPPSPPEPPPSPPPGRGHVRLAP
jgi:hypothetical protein